ncbi:hypothetical protein BDR05DRAFT_963397 [Suillus weaverae]|nr:hypothetical protein BDR05DRAFT_963397 [Suillus weaverae]
MASGAGDAHGSPLLGHTIRLRQLEGVVLLARSKEHRTSTCQLPKLDWMPHIHVCTQVLNSSPRWTLTCFKPFMRHLLHFQRLLSSLLVHPPVPYQAPAHAAINTTTPILPPLPLFQPQHRPT